MKIYYMISLLVLLVACAPAQPQVMEKKEAFTETSEEMQTEREAMEKAGMTPEEIEKSEMMEKTTLEPGLIGGDISKYYDLDKAKFDQAVAEGKTVYLEFSANWCAICQKQKLHLKAAFAELDDPNVVGFKIHYKDDQTTDEHNALAQQYQIAYQHTKVVLKGGQQVLKSPEAWTKDKFLEEMRKL